MFKAKHRFLEPYNFLEVTWITYYRAQNKWSAMRCFDVYFSVGLNRLMNNSRVFGDLIRHDTHVTSLSYTQIVKFMGPTWGPPGCCRSQMGPLLAPWILLSGYLEIHSCHWLLSARDLIYGMTHAVEYICRCPSSVLLSYYYNQRSSAPDKSATHHPVIIACTDVNTIPMKIIFDQNIKLKISNICQNCQVYTFPDKHI